VPGRIEPGAAVVPEREAEPSQHVQGLGPDGLDPVDDGRRIGGGVRRQAVYIFGDRVGFLDRCLDSVLAKANFLRQVA